MLSHCTVHKIWLTCYMFYRFHDLDLLLKVTGLEILAFHAWFFRLSCGLVLVHLAILLLI